MLMFFPLCQIIVSGFLCFQADTYGLLICLKKFIFLIISNFSLWDEFLRLIPVTSLSIFTPTTFFKEGENTLSTCSRGKIYFQYLLAYTWCKHIYPPYPPHQRLLFFSNLSWTPWKHPVVQGCFTPCLTSVTVTAIYYLWDQTSKLIALKHYHRDHQEALEVITWILWPNARRKKKIKRSSLLHQDFWLFLFS